MFHIGAQHQTPLTVRATLAYFPGNEAIDYAAAGAMAICDQLTLWSISWEVATPGLLTFCLNPFWGVEKTLDWVC